MIGKGKKRKYPVPTIAHAVMTGTQSSSTLNTGIIQMEIALIKPMTSPTKGIIISTL